MDLIVYFLQLCFIIYYILIIARIVLPFLKHPPKHPVVRIIISLTEPGLKMIRQALPPKWMGGVDYSIFVLIILLFLLQRILLFLLSSI